VQLTKRETRMLDLLTQGKDLQSIAKKLDKSYGFMRVSFHHLYKKIGVKNKTQAALWRIKQQALEEAKATA
jgi:two-component system response regulator DegU